MKIIILIILGIMILAFWQYILGFAVIAAIGIGAYSLGGIAGVIALIVILVAILICSSIGWGNVFAIVVLGALLVGGCFLIGPLGVGVTIIILIIVMMIIGSIQQKREAKAIRMMKDNFIKMGMAEVSEVVKSISRKECKLKTTKLNEIAITMLKQLVAQGEVEEIPLVEGEKKGTCLYKVKNITSGNNFESIEISLD